MSNSERNFGAVEDRFSLTVDQYGRLWLHANLDGIPVTVDLAEKDIAFEIMATTMAENGFEYRPVQEHDDADNDDEARRSH